MNTQNALNALKMFSSSIDGQFTENGNDGFLTFNNKWGEGTAKAFQLFNGLEAITFNIHSKKEIIVDNFYKDKNCLHFIFCVEGNLTHTFNGDLGEKPISRLQNVIVESYEKRSSNIIIEKNTKVKFSIITVINIDEISFETNKSSELSKLLTTVLENLNETKEYAYFGKISNNIAAHVETLIATDLIGLSNRLHNEAAVFEILSHQYTAHNKDLECLKSLNPLSKDDTTKIIFLSEYISKNLHEDISLDNLSNISGLNKKKIQKGFQFFYSETVNKFVSNLRVIKAKELLEISDDTISEIVYKIGLSSRSYFSKIFYNKFGLQPKEYRKYHHLLNPTFEISYVSETKEKISDKDIQEIFKAAKRNNESLGITGCLMHLNSKFYQILEGPKNEVLRLVEKIKKDSRNKNLTILYSGVKSGRTFCKWNMSLIKKDVFLDNYTNEASFSADFLQHFDAKNPAEIKKIWEKARNFLVKEQEISF